MDRNSLLLQNAPPAPPLSAPQTMSNFCKNEQLQSYPQRCGDERFLGVFVVHGFDGGVNLLPVQGFVAVHLDVAVPGISGLRRIEPVS